MVTLTGKGLNMPAQEVQVTINGIDVKGHPEQLAKLAAAMGVPFNYNFDQTKWHFSKSKDEWVYIADMATPYLWNAFMQEYREAIEDINSKARAKEYSMDVAIHEIVNFPNPTKYSHLSGLFQELQRRLVTGRI